MSTKILIKSNARFTDIQDKIMLMRCKVKATKVKVAQEKVILYCIDGIVKKIIEQKPTTETYLEFTRTLLVQHWNFRYFIILHIYIRYGN